MSNPNRGAHCTLLRIRLPASQSPASKEVLFLYYPTRRAIFKNLQQKIYDRSSMVVRRWVEAGFCVQIRLDEKVWGCTQLDIVIVNGWVPDFSRSKHPAPNGNVWVLGGRCLNI